MKLLYWEEPKNWSRKNLIAIFSLSYLKAEASTPPLELTKFINGPNRRSLLTFGGRKTNLSRIWKGEKGYFHAFSGKTAWSSPQHSDNDGKQRLTKWYYHSTTMSQWWYLCPSFESGVIQDLRNLVIFRVFHNFSNNFWRFTRQHFKPIGGQTIGMVLK